MKKSKTGEQLHMDKLPLVSVIVPSYNHHQYVGKCIDAIVQQSYTNIELLVIDDGSSDGSEKLLQELANQYNFIFVHRPNKGLCATLNEALAMVNGKYVCLCASDDIYDKEKISKEVEFLEENPSYGMSYGKLIQFDETGKTIKREIKNAKSGWIFDNLLMVDFSILAVSTMIRKEVYDTVGNYDESLYIEDYDMWLRIAKSYQIGYLDEYLAFYRKHETNISNQKYKMYEAEKIIFNKWKDTKIYKKALNRRELRWFWNLASEHKMEAKKYLLTALKNIYKIRTLKTMWQLYKM